MRDKNGFLIRCKNCEWMIYNDREDKDFICQQFGDKTYGYHICYGDENCKYYEPDVKKGADNA